MIPDIKVYNDPVIPHKKVYNPSCKCNKVQYSAIFRMVIRRIVQAHCNKSDLVSGNDAICFQNHSGLNTKGLGAILWFAFQSISANKSINPQWFVFRKCAGVRKKF